MRFKKALSTFLLFALILITSVVSAQTDYSTVKVDDLTDAQIRQLMQKAESIGYNDAQLEQMASAQGMKAEEIQKMRLRVEKIRKQEGSTSKATQDSNNEFSERTYAGSTQKSDTTNKKFNNYSDNNARKAELRDAFGNLIPKVFGAALFKNSNITFEPNLRMATPKSYVIGPDDELLIDLSGDNEASYKLKVSPEGIIRIQ
ncbi:polysaccharide biosynthesis/export family protein, partial [Pedobacter sp.]|uniref:polysaccharide biosynthesis/export family protein n=1 Tax=Pedobacter sp. TaxID=1411316 RepID=UPI003D7F9087